MPFGLPRERAGEKAQKGPGRKGKRSWERERERESYQQSSLEDHKCPLNRRQKEMDWYAGAGRETKTNRHRESEAHGEKKNNNKKHHKQGE